MFKGSRDAQEVEKFLWHLDNYFKCNQVKNDENKINTTVLYLSEMVMLWWMRKESEIGKGRCTINTWDQFQADFKKMFFPNNVIYEAKCKLRALKKTGSTHFTTITLKIPNLTYENMLFHFMDGLQH